MFVLLFIAVLIFCAIVFFGRKIEDDNESGGQSGTDHEKPANESDKETDEGRSV